MSWDVSSEMSWDVLKHMTLQSKKLPTIRVCVVHSPVPGLIVVAGYVHGQTWLGSVHPLHVSGECFHSFDGVQVLQY